MTLRGNLWHRRTWERRSRRGRREFKTNERLARQIAARHRNRKKNRYKKFPNKFINACILLAAILKSTPEQYSSLSEVPEIDLCNICLKSQPSVWISGFYFGHFTHCYF